MGSDRVHVSLKAAPAPDRGCVVPIGIERRVERDQIGGFGIQAAKNKEIVVRENG